MLVKAVPVTELVVTPPWTFPVRLKVGKEGPRTVPYPHQLPIFALVVRKKPISPIPKCSVHSRVGSYLSHFAVNNFRFGEVVQKVNITKPCVSGVEVDKFLCPLVVKLRGDPVWAFV